MKYAIATALLCLSIASAPVVLAQSPTESERLERLERAVDALQKRNAELEAEVRSLKKEKPSAPEKTTAPLAVEKRSHFSPDNKASVAKTEIVEEKKPIYVIPGASEIKLTLGGLLQVQYEGGDPFAFEGRFGSAAIDDRFRLRRARIQVTGEFTEQFDFKLEGEFAQSDEAITVRDATGRTLGSNATRTAFGGLDVWANWHRFPEFQIKVGQYKAPFGLEQISPDPKLLTAERSEVTSALTPERQVGIQIWGKPFTNAMPEQKDLLTYWVGMFNGDGRNITVNDNDQYMYAGRLELQPWKGKLAGQEAWVRFGGNALTSHDSPGTVLSPAGTLRVNSDGSLATFTAPSVAERDGYGFDASFHWGPFDLIGEYLSEKYESKSTIPGFVDFRAEGYYVQGSYFIVPKKLQVVTKYEHFNPGQRISDNLDSITGGVNYYIHGDDIKLVADYIHTWSNFRDARPALGSSDFDEVILRLQVIF